MMQMNGEIAAYLMKYGCLALFIMVLLQETGFPNPVPNELLLLFSGYLCSRGIMSFILALASAVAADLSGTVTLYLIFRHAGDRILLKKPKWLPLPGKTLEKLRTGISAGGNISILIFRLTPFTRGYASAVSGLIGIIPGVYLPIAVFTAMLWSFFYITAGYLFGPSLISFVSGLPDFKYVLLIMFILALITVTLTLLIKRLRERPGKIISKT